MLKKGMVVLALLAFGLLAGCVSEVNEVPTEPVTTQTPTEIVETTQEVTTEPPPILMLDMQELTLTEIGQQVTIYSGEIPA